MSNYTFELLAIDKEGQTEITKAESLFRGLLFSETLWKEAKEVVIGDLKKIVDDNLRVEVKLQPVDTSKTLNDLIESAFIIKIKGEDFYSLEKFRYAFLLHLKSRLKFSNLRILRDDISTEISNKIYPLINQVENLLRRYLVKFFIQKIGVDWWSVTASKQLNDKISSRRLNERVFNQLVDADVTLIDFDDLGELIYKQSSGFNTQENIIKKIMEANNPDDLNLLKQELQGNYTKYFKTAFQDNQFDKKWKRLFEIRNKVAHNNLFTNEDFSVAEQLVSDLTKIIDEAEAKIEEFNFSVEEQEAIRQATIDAVKIVEANALSKEEELEKLGIKVVGKIELPDDTHEHDNANTQFKIVSEEDLLNELTIAESRAAKTGMYVGLKSFVRNILGAKGYAFGPTYALINILRDKGVIEFYDADDKFSFYPAKAIRRK